MSSNHTEHYSLSQWEAEDKVLRTDFNEDNEKIDGALKGLTQSRNCQFHCITYKGDGQLSRTLSFPKRPVFLMIVGSNTNQCLVTVRDCPNASSHGAGVAIINVAWSGNKITLSYTSHTDYLCNQMGGTYYAFAMLDANS